MRNISIRIWRGPRLWKMGRQALGPRISKCHVKNVSHFNKDVEVSQIVENGQEGLGQELANVIKRMCDVSIRIWRGPDCGKWARRLWAQELANVIQRFCNILRKDLEVSQNVENGPGGLGPKS
jgi:hypothetical protein